MTGFAAIDPRLPPLLDRLTAACRETFGEDLAGVYLHGSLAFGDFCWASSDIDLLAVTAGDPSAAQKETFLRRVLALDPALPEKGLEFSLLRRADCRRPVHPMPYLLHFSNAHKARCRADPAGFAAAMRGADPDLAGHITVLRAVGKTLWGAPLESVFAPPSHGDFMDSVLRDISDCAAGLEIMPVYAILNLCRTLALEREGLVLSKLQGAAWALERVPARFVPVIEEAMDCQRTGRPFSGEIPPDFLPWMQSAIG